MTTTGVVIAVVAIIGQIHTTKSGKSETPANCLVTIAIIEGRDQRERKEGSIDTATRTALQSMQNRPTNQHFTCACVVNV